MAPKNPGQAMLTDNPRRYGWISIILHWVGAALVVALFLIGEQLEDLTRGPERQEVLWLHVSLGCVAVLVLGGRFAWRIVQRSPELPPQPRLLRLLSMFVQWALLILIAVLIVSGPLIQWTAGQAIAVFDLFALPTPLPRMHGLHEVLEEVHDIAAHLLIPLVLLHVLGALKHLVVDRDGTFMRIIRVRSSD